MRKAFTLAETLIAIVIIGVIAGFLIPVLNNIKPDKERVLYKKALYTMQNAIATAINDNTLSASNTSAFWAGDEIGATDFCNNIAETMNIMGNVNCDSAGTASSPNFVTVNGAKWWGLGGSKFTLTGASKIKTITVDIDGDSGKNTTGVDQLKMQVRYDGRVTTGTGTDWDVENNYLKDTTTIQK